ncbi:inosine 5-monophosphate dehydrogenase [Streptomyces badius]
MSKDLVLLDADIDPRDAFHKLDGANRKLAPAVDADGRLVGILTRKAALRATLYTPATDAEGKLRIAAAVGINGDVAWKAKQLLDAGADVLVVDTAHGHQESMISAVKAVRALDPQVPIVAGDIVAAEGGARPDRGGRGHHQGRRRPRRHVHHPDDDRRRPPAVLRRPGVRRRGEEARQARLGGRRRPAPARRRHGARRRRVQRDAMRFSASRHVRVARRPSAVRRRPLLQGVLRDGLCRAAVKNRTSDESAYDRARKALFEEGISTSRMFLDPARPGVEDLIDSIIAGVRSSCTYAGAGSLAEFAEKAVVGVQSAAGYAEGKPLHASWS